MRSIRLAARALPCIAALAMPIGLAWAKPIPHSHVPEYIIVGGATTPSGGPDPSISFTVNVRDFLNAPIPGSYVEVNFSNCSDTRLCTAVVAGQTVVCTSRTVSGITDADGNVTMSILGGGTNDGTAVPPNIGAGSGSGCIRIYADGVQLGAVTAVVLDLNGARPGGNGVNGQDLSIALSDVGAISLGAPYKGRTDYNRDGYVNGADIAALVYGVGRSGVGLGSGAGCASGGTTQPYCP